jgi:glucose/arabinose dehydrogenase
MFRRGLAGLCVLVLSACGAPAVPAESTPAPPLRASLAAPRAQIATVEVTETALQAVPPAADRPLPTANALPPTAADLLPTSDSPDPTANAPTPSALVPNPTPPSAATRVSLPTTTACPPAPSGAPVSTRLDVCVRRLFNAGPGFIRIRRDSNGVPFVLNTQGEIQQIVFEGDDNVYLRSHASAAQIGGGSFTLGFAIGPDDAMYVVGHSTRGKEGKCIVRTQNAADWYTLVETEWYPMSGTQYDHQCNGIIVSPDNAFVYFNVGSRTDHGEVQDNGGAFPGLREVPLTSAVFRVPRTARDLLLPNDEVALKAGGYLFADGLRNAFDLNFAADGRLYAVDNGPDADYPDELNLLVNGGHYGFPWRFGVQDNPQRAPGYDAANDKYLQTDFVAVKKGLYRNDPEFPAPPATPFTDPIVNTGPDANQFRAEDSSMQTGSVSTFTPHRSPLGLMFDRAGRLGGSFKYSGFVLSWGSAGGTLTDRGQDLLWLQLQGTGRVQTEILVRGFKRPIDAVLSDSIMFVLDWEGDGAVWQITLPGG